MHMTSHLRGLGCSCLRSLRTQPNFQTYRKGPVVSCMCEILAEMITSHAICGVGEASRRLAHRCVSSHGLRGHGCNRTGRESDYDGRHAHARRIRALKRGGRTRSCR